MKPSLRSNDSSPSSRVSYRWALSLLNNSGLNNLNSGPLFIASWNNPVTCLPFWGQPFPGLMRHSLIEESDRPFPCMRVWSGIRSSNGRIERAIGEKNTGIVGRPPTKQTREAQQLYASDLPHIIAMNRGLAHHPLPRLVTWLSGAGSLVASTPTGPGELVAGTRQEWPKVIGVRSVGRLRI